MTRLTYHKEDGWLYTSEILCGSIFVQISLDLINLKYSIDTTGKKSKTLKTGTANTLVSLKRKAKSAVIDLGATFYSELRNRGRTERYGTK